MQLDNNMVPIKNAMQFMHAGMKNEESKVPVCGSGPFGGSSWRLVVGEKLYVRSLQSGYYVGQMI